MDERAAMLRAVLENAEDDTVRLAFADWLEENGEPERAEFVRVQCHLDSLYRQQTDLFNDEADWARCTGVSASWCPNCGDCSCKHRWPDFGPRNDPGCSLHAPDSPHDCWHELVHSIENAREMEAELFSADWLPACGGQLREWYFHCYPESHVPDRPFSFLLSRGFVSEVRLPAASFTEKIARELFSRHPVTKVVLTDLEPHSAPDLRDPPRGERSFLWLFSVRRLFGFPKSLTGRFDTRDAALAAMSDACVDWGRSLVEPPLTPLRESCPSPATGHSSSGAGK